MERGSRPRGSRAGNKLKLKPQTENSENGKKKTQMFIVILMTYDNLSERNENRHSNCKQTWK